MRVMYVACNPNKAETLALEREVTALQRSADDTAGEPATFKFYPSLPIEELPREISKQKPDVLHISAHGDDAHLSLATADRAAVQLTASVLRDFLNYDRPPRVVYLNSCDSEKMAEELATSVPMAIGTTAPMSNKAARESALLFYDRLLEGATVQRAHEAGRAMLAALQSPTVQTVLHCGRGIDPRVERMHHIPKLVARFADNRVRPDRAGYYGIEAGVMGCPHNTMQLLLFTDDRGFIDADEGDPEDESFLAEQLCRVVRATPVRGAIWSDGAWDVLGDFRAFACGVTAAGDLFTAKASICEALETHYQSALGSSAEVVDAAVKAIAKLRQDDGFGGPLPPVSEAVPKGPRRASSGAKRVTRATSRHVRRKSKK